MSTNGKRILVVEDDEVNLMIAKHILGRAGFEVSAVNNGEEAIEIVAQESFDLILMDIEMPIMDGVEATPVIRRSANGANVPIIALTAHSMQEKLDEFKAAGMDDYIIKPFDGSKFQAIVDKYLN
ncbi:MAG: response regulator [Bacteroidota bacterium]